MRYLLTLLLAGACFAQAPYRSLTGGYGSATMPSTATFNGLTALRFECRYSLSGTSGRIANLGSILINQGTGVISITSFYGGSNTITLNYGAETEVIFRVQQNATHLWVDGWSPDGARYIQGQSVAQPLGTVDLRGDVLALRHGGSGTGGTAGTFAWLRAYSSVVGGPGGSPASPFRDTTYVRNAPSGTPLYRYELEANGTDSGPNAVTMTMTSATYGSTPVVAQVGESQTVRTGTAAALDCSGTNADSYRWSYQGTEPVTIAAPTSGSTTANGLLQFGTYVFRCEVTINGVSSASLLRIGAVSTNSSGVVIHPNARIATILAPSMRTGASPWSFYDTWRPRRMRAVGASIVTEGIQDFDTPAPGTISVSNGSTTVTGVGTDFSTRYGANAVIHVYYDQGGGVISRWRATVASVGSNTSLTLAVAWPKPTQSGVQHQRWGTGDGSDASTRWNERNNYYDNGLAAYVTWAKTGLDEFATLGDQIGRWWYLYMDRGTDLSVSPRSQMWDGILIAAERGVLPSAEVYTNAHTAQNTSGAQGYQNWIAERTTADNYTNLYFGARESGYAWRYGFFLSQLHPDAGTRAAWQTKLDTHITTYWRNLQCKPGNPAGRCQTADGEWRWEDGGARGGGPWTVPVVGTEPWHIGVAMRGIIGYHRASSNATASTTLTAWVNNLMTGTQPGGIGSGKLYLDDVASDFAGVNCHRHYYTHLGGSLTAYTSGLNQGAGCSGGVDAVYGGRDINNEMIGAYGYAFRLTGDTAIRTRGDAIFGATYGATDGFHSQWAWAGASNQPKTLAQALCCNDSYLVDRLDTAQAATTATNITAFAGFNLASISGATQARITVRKPDQSTTQTTCSTSPCSVNWDSRQGRAAYRIDYLSAGSVVLAASDWSPLGTN